MLPRFDFLIFDKFFKKKFQICSFAVAVRDKIDNFIIRHLSDEMLKIRIGVHSGPLVGGVVGQQMLRWCLFGETRILADKLESTGKSRFIHISKEGISNLFYPFQAKNEFLTKIYGFSKKYRFIVISRS